MKFTSHATGLFLGAAISLSGVFWASAAGSQTVVNVDQFVVIKNGIVNVDDPFSDSVPPPQTEATFPGGGPATYFARGVFGTGCNPNASSPTTTCTDIGGKTTMDSDIGSPSIRNLFSSTGLQIFANDLTRNHAARFLTNRSNDPVDLGRGLKTDDDIEVLGLFDLVAPVRGTTNYGLGLDDFISGAFLGRNDALRLSVIRRTFNLDTVVSFFRFEQGAGPNGADLVTNIARSAPFTAAEFSNAQILLRLTTPANDNTVTAQYAFVNSPIDITDTAAVSALTFVTLPNTDTIFDGELWTRARIRLVQRVTDLAGVELTGGPTTSIAQDVGTGATPVDLIFNYRFETPAGVLTVSLDGTVLGTIVAPDPVTSTFETARLPVDGSLLGMTGLELKFEITGATPSTVKIDNILFPGLSNGNFATGDLSNWTVVAPGTGTASAFLIERVEAATVQITKAKVKTKRGKTDLDIKGRLTLGIESDGINPLDEDVTVSIGGFVQTIPAGSFFRKEDDDDDDDDDRSEKRNFRFEGSSGGITRIDIREDGKFRIKGKRIDFGTTNFDNPVPFSIQIGNDLAQTDVMFVQR